MCPRWLRDALPSGDARFRISDADGKPLWEQATFDIQAKVVCATCNNGWMSDLEAICGPLLTDPMLSGSKLTVGVAQQRAIALWVIKTAVVLEASRRDDVFKHLPEWHARWMPRTRESGDCADPPPGISVVMFGRRVDPELEDSAYFTVSRSVGIAARTPPHDSKGYVATLVIGYVGFQVFGVNLRAGGLPKIWYGPWVVERTIPLWPPAGIAVTWPPALVMSTADALRFADLWATPETGR